MIRIKHTKRHRPQAGPVVGDYFKSDHGIEIRVSYFDDPIYEDLIAVHELIESLLCFRREINFKKVDKFDREFKGKGEPGDRKNAPYHKEHVFATKVEKMMAKELGINWKKYDKELINDK